MRVARSLSLTVIILENFTVALYYTSIRMAAFLVRGCVEFFW